MANKTAEEFLGKVLSDEALKARLADMAPAQAAEVAAELGYEVTVEELIAAEKELRRQNSPDVVELELEDMDKAAGGSRDWAAQGCAATVEDGSWCWGTDYCFLANVTYTHRLTTIKCPSCGNYMYHDESYVDHGMPKIRYKCQNCGAEKIEIPPHSLK